MLDTEINEEIRKDCVLHEDDLAEAAKALLHPGGVGRYLVDNGEGCDVGDAEVVRAFIPAPPDLCYDLDNLADFARGDLDTAPVCDDWEAIVVLTPDEAEAHWDSSIHPEGRVSPRDTVINAIAKALQEDEFGSHDFYSRVFTSSDTDWRNVYVAVFHRHHTS